MAIGLKMDFEFRDQAGEGWATFGDLQRFVAKGEAAGVDHAQPLGLETSERDELTGFSIYLPVDF